MKIIVMYINVLIMIVRMLKMIVKVMKMIVKVIVLKIVYVGVCLVLCWCFDVCWCFDEASKYKGWVIKLDLTTPVKF